MLEGRMHYCSFCNFSPSKKSIFIYHVNNRMREKAIKEKYPQFVGRFSLSGWPGHAPFYIFWCEKCLETAIDYPHGFPESRLYMNCQNCNERMTVNPDEVGEIYEKERMFPDECEIGVLTVVRLLFNFLKNNLCRKKRS